MAKTVFEKTKGLTNKEFTYCPGCPHGIIHRLVAEVLVELDIIDNTINISPVGCAVFANDFFNCDGFQASHGRAPAVATGIKRVVGKEKIVFTYQGDGDLASIGAAEIVSAAQRSENITVIFVNNAIYGMTGGQMAPTTMPGQVTTTSPYGRDPETQGMPLKVSEMIATIPGARYIARVSTDTPANIRKAKKAIKRAFEYQVEGKGFAMVELLSTCNVNWGMTPVESMDWLRDNMLPYYPLGVYRDDAKEDK
jgi:2-oxoglutarate ferredoxin oxidoreductase subunit beta